MECLPTSSNLRWTECCQVLNGQHMPWAINSLGRSNPQPSKTDRGAKTTLQILELLSFVVSPGLRFVCLCPVGWQFGDKLIVAGKEGLDLRKCQRWGYSHLWEDHCALYQCVKRYYTNTWCTFCIYTIYNAPMYSDTYSYINFMLCLEWYSNFKSMK